MMRKPRVTESTDTTTGRPQLVERYIARLGCVCLVSPEDLGDAAILAGEARLAEYPRFQEEILARLKAHPNLTEVEDHFWGDTAEVVMVRWPGAEGTAPSFQGHCSCRVHLPRKNQALPDSYDGYVIEDFRLLYNGAVFAAYAPLPQDLGVFFMRWPTSCDWQFGKESERVVTGALAGAEGWVVSPIGPTPIHPCYFIDFVRRSTVDERASAREESGDIHLTIPVSETETPEQIVGLLLGASLRPVSDFYGAMLLRYHIDDTLADLSEIVRAMADKHSELLDLHWWNPQDLVKRYRLLGEVRRDVARAYGRYMLHSELSMGLGQTRDFVSEILSQQITTMPLARYASQELSDRSCIDPAALMQSLRFFEEEARSGVVQRATIDAAVAAAILGAAVGAILAK